MSNPATITVEATGIASAPPDIARVSLFTFAEDPAPGDALTSCSLLTERVLGALRDAGVAPSDLETTSIDLNVRHHREPEEAVPLYRSSRTGVGINDVAFDIDDRSPLTSLARRDAVANALTAARELADAAGVTLGRLVELGEGRGLRPPYLPSGLPMRAAAAGRTLGGGPPPVELGELSVTVTVSAVFEVTAALSG
jgi:uncharacterized protein YggE